MAVVKPFRALRYDTSVAGPLESLVAPPYDVISAEARLELLERSPRNVVRLTLPDSEEEAARTLRAWRGDGTLIEEPPAMWILSQDYVGPDGVARRREGIVASLKVEPYTTKTVLPHERTHRGPLEGRLRSCAPPAGCECSCRSHDHSDGDEAVKGSENYGHNLLDGAEFCIARQPPSLHWIFLEALPLI